jgi:hypothetical protein
MVDTHYHIGYDFYRKFLNLKVLVLSVFSALKYTLSIPKLHTGFADSLTEDLSSIHLSTEGYKVIIKNFTKEKASLEYKSAERSLFKFRSLYSKLEKVEFFHNKEIEVLSEQILLNYYSIEGELRSKAFSDVYVEEDLHLQKFASSLSSSS